MNVQLWTDLSQLKTQTFSLPLMKISTYHKAKGDNVEWHNPMLVCDLLYCSKVFSSEFTSDNLYTHNADKVIKGGTGYNLQDNLPFDIEHQYPNYVLYNMTTAVGFITRGCPNNCEFCICSKKEGLQSKQVAEVTEFWKDQSKITLFDPNVLACKDRERIFKQLAATKAEIRFEQGLDARFITDDSIALLKTIKISEFYFAWDLEKNSDRIKHGLLQMKKAYPKLGYSSFCVYVLVNYNTDWQFDIHRIDWLKANGFDPYVMIYEKWNADKKYLHLQRAVNNKFIFRSIKNLSEYKPLEKYLT